MTTLSPGLRSPSSRAVKVKSVSPVLTRTGWRELSGLSFQRIWYTPSAPGPDRGGPWEPLSRLPPPPPPAPFGFFLCPLALDRAAAVLRALGLAEQPVLLQQGTALRLEQVGGEAQGA